MAGAPTSLIGREEVLERVTALLAAPGSGGVTLVGPAGIGKSRLAREIAERQPDDVAVRAITATRATSEVPLGAFAHYLPPDAGTFGLPALLLIRHGLSDGLDGQRLLLVVDDAQLLDEASAALVLQLALTGEARVVATQRAGEPAPDAVTRLWRDRVLERLDLDPLDLGAVAAVAADALGGPLDGPSAARLLERSGGNPLYVHELLLAGREAGEWVEGPGGWRWDAGTAASPRLADLLLDRIDSLAPEQREALEYLAFGEPLELAELQAVASDAVIDDLERAGFVTAELDGRRLKVRTTHPLHADAVRRGVSPLRARRVRARLVEVLTSTGLLRREDDVRLATLAADAGVELPVETVTRAARGALFASDHELAVRLGEEAFERSPSFETGRVLADALYERGDPVAIHAHLARWEPMAGSDDEAAIACLLRAVTAYYREADATAAFALLDAAADGLPDCAWRDEVIGLRATLLMMSGRHHEALALAGPLLVDRGPDRVLVQATLAVTQALHCLGRGREALQAADRALAAYEVLGPQATLVSSSVLGVLQCSIHVDLGAMDAALAAGDAARRDAMRTGDATTEGLAEMVRSDALAHLGRLGEAVTAARSADAAFLRLNHTAFRRWAVEQRALVASLAGDAAGVDEALADLDALGPHPALLFENAEIIARAAQANLAGDAERARTLLVDGAQRMAERGERTGAARCWYELARLGVKGAAEPLRHLAPELDGKLAPAMLAHAEAAEASDADGLAAAAAALAELGALVMALSAASQATEAYIAAGDARTAARWAEQTAAWTARCQLVAPPRGAVSSSNPLTRREREVALLAAQGLPSRTIAERLFVSRRTVDNHLGRAYDKLGVRSRVELARVLAPA